MAAFDANTASEASNAKRKRDNDTNTNIDHPRKIRKLHEGSTNNTSAGQAANVDPNAQSQTADQGNSGTSVQADVPPPQAVVQVIQPADTAGTIVNAVVTTTVADDSSGALESAGLLFGSFGNAENGLLATVRQSYAQEQTKPSGFVQERGNMCYRNSVIAGLLNCQRFMSYVTNWHMDKENPDEQLDGTELNNYLYGDNYFPNRILCDLHTLGKAYWSKQPKKVPKGGLSHDRHMKEFFNQCIAQSDGLMHETDDHGNTWRSWAQMISDELEEQQDAAAFLGWLMSAIEGQLGRDSRYDGLKRDTRSGIRPPQQNFNHLFRLRMTERGACAKCQYPVWHRRHHVSPVTEHSLLVHIPKNVDSGNGAIPSLEDSIREYMNVEKDYECSRCKQNSVNLPVRLRIQSLPEVLFVNLNRTAHNEKHQPYKRLDKVQIPETLDLSEWLEHHEYGPGSRANYRLSAIISHSGTGLNFGHYISIVRAQSNPTEWFQLNDDVVTRESLDQWDDSSTRTRSSSRRWTPVLMIYEREEDVRNAGSTPMNVGWVKDVPPPSAGTSSVEVPFEKQAVPQTPPQATLQAATQVTPQPSTPKTQPQASAQAGIQVSVQPSTPKAPPEVFNPAPSQVAPQALTAKTTPRAPSPQPPPHPTPQASAPKPSPEATLQQSTQASPPASVQTTSQAPQKIDPRQDLVPVLESTEAAPKLGDLSGSGAGSAEPIGQSHNSDDSLFGDVEPGDVADLFSQSNEPELPWPGAGTLTSTSGAPDSDAEFERAELYINVQVGQYVFDFPRRTLDHFNPSTERDMVMKAVLKTVDPKTKEEMYLELMSGEDGAKKTWRRKSVSSGRVHDEISEAGFSKTFKPNIPKSQPAKAPKKKKKRRRL